VLPQIRRPELLQADLQALKSLSEVYPIAEAVIRRLNDLRSRSDHYPVPPPGTSPPLFLGFSFFTRSSFVPVPSNA
jgi:hypothetical protein